MRRQQAISNGVMWSELLLKIVSHEFLPTMWEGINDWRVVVELTTGTSKISPDFCGYSFHTEYCRITNYFTITVNDVLWLLFPEPILWVTSLDMSVLPDESFPLYPIFCYSPSPSTYHPIITSLYTIPHHPVTQPWFSSPSDTPFFSPCSSLQLFHVSFPFLYDFTWPYIFILIFFCRQVIMVISDDCITTEYYDKMPTNVKWIITTHVQRKMNPQIHDNIIQCTLKYFIYVLKH